MMLQKLADLLVMAVFSFLSLSCDKKDDNNPPTVVPVVRIENASVVRTTTTAVMHFNITLNKTANAPASVDYTLVDGTAIAAKDYSNASGTIHLPANQSTTEVAVQIKGDPTNTRQDNLEFTVQLSNPKGCTLGVASAKGTIITEDGTNFTTDNNGVTTPLTYPGYTLVWNDEFSGTTLDANIWNFETGNGSNGWGNNELEYYTNSTKNAFVSNGNLIIEARKESIGGFNYSSARLTTQNKKSFTYGRIDIRAKLPKGKGVWPALWMLGNNITSAGWPACGEIDIMELLGHEITKSYGTLHYGSSSATHGSKGTSFTLSSSSFYDQFHVFSMDWKQDQIKLYVDNNLFLTVNKSDVGTAPYPFNAPFFFIFNVAVGGNWPGSPDATTTFPQRMIVDYIRVFQ
ncbi:family 16 glycosylhydrolase [Chitinophagaceae bacterium LB-8]|uniref:Family 16 glycosylhydrolase n=1 Tax=Paraflavisolibacter caeni TaxID=2982496 RepID=A0A9X2XP21_9BACT|nr:family 16 glycosylhydrolase [Paraflavisolibacter caeni]MCU7549704.1 family 16 glycosylhydrolase [Paraflavisolibacter caeni]